MSICNYGCGNKGRFKFKNGKWCCESSYNKCPSIRKRNSEGLKLSHKNGKQYSFTIEDTNKGRKTLLKKLTEKYLTMPFDSLPYAERRRIIIKEQQYKCKICGINKWNEKELKLHLDHIDGDKTKNSRENLRLICPNCHSQTETYCRAKN